MKIRQLLISLLLATNALGAASQVSKTYYVSKPGTLISMMTQEEANSVTHLTLTGKLNAEDFRHLRDEFNNLKVLDISNAEIKMYSGKAGTYPDGKFYMYMPNFIPAYAFSNVVNGVTKGKATLEKVILSEKTKNIEDAAFKGCDKLKICQIRKKTAPNLLPEALADSITAIFVPLGSSDEYRNKNRWEKFAFIEGEPVETTLQVGAMGKLEDEIISAGLQPKDINFLTIEGKLDNADFKLIRDYMPNLVSIDISNTNVTAIPDFTFSQKKYLLRVYLPHNLKSIGQRVFSNCGRLCGTLELPPSVTAIEYGAFMGCDNLRHVVATGNKITTLGDDLFGANTPSKLIYKK
ncbi:leucine-rich repeat domain-containing protein [Bacteroides faecichinchillae]|uniref:Leucine rich repeat-containing protein n=1 Tax=Bacteroides faecichinchillae TaxID=871325 RepID=A0A1M5BRJ7_9BACE|nr:leucine-rich repeat domain-containing protein [Bacteroides faecichinchillae]THG63539.1 leucine-rich repeat domain-containing protein [Bacteroides faecichinchillae]SHF45138.1 Leucine rich repeat-containing protein [Bacteroides faecichinchillae]